MKEFCRQCNGLVAVTGAGCGSVCDICGAETRTPHTAAERQPVSTTGATPAAPRSTRADQLRKATHRAGGSDSMLKLADGDWLAADLATLAYRIVLHIGAAEKREWLPVVRNTRTSAADTKHGFVLFGWEDLSLSASLGFREYPSIAAACWGGNVHVPGAEAVYRICIHELAHLLQAERDGLWRGSVHNTHFVAALLELKTRYPWPALRGLAGGLCFLMAADPRL